MDYRSWSVEGYGFDIDSVISKEENEEKIIALAKAFIKDKNIPIKINDQDGMMELLIATSKYESQFGIGSGFFFGEVFMWMWESQGFRRDIIGLCYDEFGSKDVFFLLETVLPWVDTGFKTYEETEKAVLTTFDGILREEDLCVHSIEQGEIY